MSNLFNRFRRLMPAPPLRVGVVQSVTNGVALVQEIGGGYVNVRGEAGVGDRVFFRDQTVEGPAPDLPLEVVEI